MVSSLPIIFIARWRSYWISISAQQPVALLDRETGLGERQIVLPGLIAFQTAKQFLRPGIRHFHARPQRVAPATLNRDFHHRVKNTLATVHAVIVSTARCSQIIAEFQHAVTERIASLAKTHTLLTLSLIHI